MSREQGGVPSSRHVNELVEKGYLMCVLANNTSAQYTGHNRLKFTRIKLRLEPMGNTG